MKRFIASAVIGAALTAASVSAALAGTLDDVKAKGFVQCGVNPSLIGFGIADEKGEWSGIDVDFCRAVASAIFGDATKVKFSPLNAKERFTALQSKEVDLLSRNTTWTMSRDSSLGLMFAGVMYYDGQGFMVRKDLGISSALELSGATVCTQTGTTTELNLADYFRSHNMEYKVLAFEKNEEVLKAYEDKRCEAYTTDASGLYAERLKLTSPDDHMILPEIISKEPLGPAVRQGDDPWFTVVKWTLFALINAEELGLTKQNIDEKKTADSPEIKRFVGVEGDFGTGIGLTNDWAYKIVKNVGNYGEIFDANIGPSTKLGIARGLNNLWSKGGIQYAPPIR
ncbi:amino acid ABC transporter substrate-binding protein [Kaistia algarum]|uniref:amino acid ABC transporter substrate-binding protein n=1 Tax=Kaistia algarum TaxID=2083279 RepID=UPI000CE8B019|nr:amino acid ABC transporter substrate-binding protein [Kaistia algarum]MCX5514921.1 amino acid ABC transporter substrate-binding protein [Kaistia algarum]PPE79669.1 amino acid ABC transporter substrate-binding protein [Kaistia algarum]